jgi:hypothetical protein
MQLNALLTPLKLSAAITLVGLLTACSGNSSSTTLGPAAVIDPIEVDKAIAEVVWSPANYVENSSHAYRVVTKNSMLRLVFTNQLAAFDTLVNLLRVDTDRDCNISGRVVAEQLGEICYEAGGTTEEDCVDESVLRFNTQTSQSIACQDGTVTGQYFDGFFNITSKTDLTVTEERRTSTKISAIGSAPTFGEDGFPILDEDGDPVLKDFTDYLFQSDISTFFFDSNYESYVDFSDDKLICGENEFNQVVRQGMRSEKVGTQEGDGTNNFYLYTELTNLDLQAIPTYTCDEATEKVTTDYAYNLNTTLASAAMGGGIDSNTLATWPDMDISLAGEPSGVLTLVHENTDGAYTVAVDFNTDGQVTLTPDVGAPSTLTLAEFLALSEPVTPEPAAE